jgi:hypothetical protein
VRGGEGKREKREGGRGKREKRRSDSNQIIKKIHSQVTF